MIVAAIAGIVFSVALILRELQLARERTTMARQARDLAASLERTRQILQRTAEEVYVLQSVLEERNLLDEGDMARARARLIEQPRRQAQERAALLPHVKGSETQLVIDDGIDKIH